MNDRKHKYDGSQLDKFVVFKSKMSSKLGSQAVQDLSDNIYCRFLDGYLFNLEEAEKHMTNYLVRPK